MPSALPTSDARYTRTAVLLHWLMAVLLMGLVGFGAYMADLPFSPQRLKLFNWHKWAGIVALALLVARGLWRLSHRPPALPDRVMSAMPAWQQLAHHATHGALYLLMLLVPLLGWAYSSAAGFPVVLFGTLPLPDFVPADKALAELIKPWHGRAAWLLVLVTAVHVAAALKHQFIDRDGLLQRMSLR